MARARLLWVGLLGLALLAPHAPQAADKAELKQLEKSLAQDKAKAEELSRKAKKLRGEIAELQDQMIAAAAEAQDLEDDLSGIEATIGALEAEEAVRLDDLLAERSKLSGTLGALQRIAVQPPEALLAAPGSPVDIVRSAMLLQVAVPAIERRADAVREQLDGLRAVRQQIAVEREQLAVAADVLEGKRQTLSGLIDRKLAYERVTTVEQQAALIRVEKLASEAKDLRDLLDRLERDAKLRAEEEAREEVARAAEAQAEREATARAEAELQAELQAETLAKTETEAESKIAPETQTAALTPAAPVDLAKPANVRPFPEEPSTAGLLMPARGTVIGRYGQRSDEGDPASKGITIETRDSAQVVAPYDGRVAYAGHFRGYGQILIIEHGGRYHTLLAGLDRIDAIVGQWVLAGEPVGIMSSTPSSKPRLYLELRRTGQPINPLPWLAATSNNVQG